MTSCKSYSIEEFSQLQQKVKGVSILNINIRSLRKNFSKLNLFLESIDHKFDLICLTETFIYDNETLFFTLNNYVFVGKTRETRGGGVGIFVHKSLEVSRGRLAVAGSEALLLTVGGAGWASSYKITLLYRQPSAEVGEFLESLEEHLFTTGNNPHIILGDINIDTSSSDTRISNDYISLIHSFNFINTITVPTRISEQKSSILDHILINFDSTYISGAIYTDISDHLPSFIVLNPSSFPDKSKPTYCKHMTIDKTECVKLVGKINWEFLYNINDTEEATSAFTQKLKEIVNACSKVKSMPKMKLSNHETKKWITPALKHKIKKKNRLFRKVCLSPLNSRLRSKYVVLRNEVTRDLKRAKIKYFEERLNSFNSSHEMWKFLKTETGFNFNTKAENPTLRLLNPANDSFVEGTAVADLFNAHFSTIGNKLASRFSDSPGLFTAGEPERSSGVTESFEFSAITPERFLMLWKSLMLIKPLA